MRLTFAFSTLAVVARAAQDLSTALAPTPTLLERQIGVSSVHYTSCTGSGGISVACSLVSSSTATSATNGVPGPTQKGIVPSCTKYLETNPSGASCSAFASRVGINIMDLYKWNTILGPNGENCTSQFLNSEYYCVGVASSSSTSTKTTTPAPGSPTSSSASTTSSPFTWTSVQTNPKSYNMALTTVFTSPPECTGSFTQVGSLYWQDVINPAPQKTLTSCYPSQFYSSVVAAANSVSLPAFNPLVCPSGWDSLPYNDTYVVCCPDGWGAIAPNLSDVQRPLSGAICTSLILSGFFFDVTSYNSAGSTTVFPTKAGSQGGFLLATGFDGIAGTAASTAATPTTSRTACASATSLAVTFDELVTTTYGDTIYLVGSIPELGSWSPSSGVPLSAAQYTTSNPLWSVTVNLAPGTSFEYKFVTVNGTDGTTTWEADPNHTLTVPSACASPAGATESASWQN